MGGWNLKAASCPFGFLEGGVTLYLKPVKMQNRLFLVEKVTFVHLYLNTSLFVKKGRYEMWPSCYCLKQKLFGLSFRCLWHYQKLKRKIT